MSRDRRRDQRVAFRGIVDSMERRRGMGAPLRNEFFRTRDGRYPMKELMSTSSRGGGGRGGRTRILLYLSLLWVASGKGHEVQRPASFWSDLLLLGKDQAEGSRSVRSAWRDLQARGFVSTRKAPDAFDYETPQVSPLREDGSGRAYEIPDGSSQAERYLRVPEAAWKFLFSDPELSGPGLVMYLVALSTAGRAQSSGGLVFPVARVQELYGVGRTTQKQGLENLCFLDVLEKTILKADEVGERTTPGRRRAVYSFAPYFGPASVRPRGKEPQTRPSA